MVVVHVNVKQWYCNINSFHYHMIKFLRHYAVQSGTLTEFDSYWSDVTFTLLEGEV